MNKLPRVTDLLMFGFLLWVGFMMACHKEKKPAVYGNWETVNAVGFHWEYKFTNEGQFCRRLPEYFPDTSFCFSFQVDKAGTTTIIATPESETWIWDFVADDVADVNVTRADGEKQRFILKRRN